MRMTAVPGTLAHPHPLSGQEHLLLTEEQEIKNEDATASALPPDARPLRQGAENMSGFQQAFLDSPVYARWKNVGYRNRLQSDEEIACFLVKYYDDTVAVFPSGSTMCMMCQTPLTASCATCGSIPSHSTGYHVTPHNTEGGGCQVNFHTNPASSSHSDLQAWKMLETALKEEEDLIGSKQASRRKQRHTVRIPPFAQLQQHPPEQQQQPLLFHPPPSGDRTVQQDFVDTEQRFPAGNNQGIFSAPWPQALPVQSPLGIAEDGSNLQEKLPIHFETNFQELQKSQHLSQFYQQEIRNNGCELLHTVEDAGQQRCELPHAGDDATVHNLEVRHTDGEANQHDHDVPHTVDEVYLRDHEILHAVDKVHVRDHEMSHAVDEPKQHQPKLRCVVSEAKLHDYPSTDVSKDSQNDQEQVPPSKPQSSSSSLLSSPRSKKRGRPPLDSYQPHKSLQCSQCQKLYHSKQGLMMHMKLKHFIPGQNDRGLLLSSSKEAPSRRGSRKLHKARRKNSQSVSSTLTFECSECKFKVKTKKGLRHHIKLKHGSKLLCSVCLERFTSHQEFHEHMDSVHGRSQPVPECTVCNLTFPARAALRRHVHLMHHPGDVTLICQTCWKWFENRQNLDVHVESAHPDAKSFLCETCGDNFPSKILLQKHKTMHQERITCRLCGKSIFHRSWDDHMRRHKGERTWRCEVCAMTFVRKDELQLHAFVHSQQWPFCCEICGMRYRQKGSLTSHLRTHTGEKPYQCSQCEACFTRPRGLRDHRRIHTGERPYECAVCHRRFSNSGNLSTHRRTVHKLSPIPRSQQSSKHNLRNIGVDGGSSDEIYSHIAEDSMEN